jgi:hypothetical protein
MRPISRGFGVEIQKYGGVMEAGSGECMVDWVLVLEYAKVFWSSTTVVLLIGLSGLALFRTEIRKLIGRIQGAKFPGGSIDAPIDQHQETAEQLPAGPLGKAAGGVAVPALAESGQDRGPVTGRVGGNAPPHPQPDMTLGPEARDLPQAASMLAYAIEKPGPTVTEFVRTFLFLRFERFLNVAYGTQLALLDAMAKDPKHSWSVDEMSAYYERHRAQTEKPTEFSTWVGFLQVSEWIAPTDQPLHYRITPAGWRFVDYRKAAYGEGLPHRFL